MGYTRGASGVRFGLIALISAQLAGCATARDVTRGAGTAIGVAGALALLVAMDPDCDSDIDVCPNDDDPYYEEDTLQTRAVIAASGGAAVVIGGALIAASNASKPKAKPRPPAKPAPPPVAAAPANAPDPAHAAAVSALIEKRCIPPGGIDLRVVATAAETLPYLPPCGVSDPAAVPAPAAAPNAPAAAPSAPAP